MEKVLVCIIASTRAHKLSFPRFKQYLLDELNADLALALVVDKNYDYSNPFWQTAKYRWKITTFEDWGKAFDLAQRSLCKQHNVPAPDWRSMLRIKGIWQGGIHSSDPQPSKSSILPFCRWLLLNGLLTDNILDRYDRFVITRSDFIWLCPHPPLSILDRDAIWIPDGEHWWGLQDRHLVASRDDAVNCLNVIEDILLNPVELYEEMKHHSAWNNEQLLALHFDRKGLRGKVKMFPYVMYTARSVWDRSPSWSDGRYEPTVGHFVKYENEFRTASTYASIIQCRTDWEKENWKTSEPKLVITNRAPPLQRLRYACERSYYSTLSALLRPGRLARVARYYNDYRILSALLRPGRVARFARYCKKLMYRSG